jgi:hypothetical protein
VEGRDQPASRHGVQFAAISPSPPRDSNPQPVHNKLPLRWCAMAFCRAFRSVEVFQGAVRIAELGHISGHDRKSAAAIVGSVRLPGQRAIRHTIVGLRVAPARGRAGQSTVAKRVSPPPPENPTPPAGRHRSRYRLSLNGKKCSSGARAGGPLLVRQSSAPDRPRLTSPAVRRRKSGPVSASDRIASRL